MYQELTFKIKGVAPLLLHNGRLANPLDPFSKRLKKVSGKRGKTDEDYALMSEIEFFGGLYTENGRVIIPGDCIEAMLIEAAKKKRKGKVAKAALLCTDNFPLIYDGPRDPQELWEDERFRLIKTVRIGSSRVMRTRPKFDEWELEFTVLYEPSLLNPEEVLEFVNIAGSIVGLADWRPRFGRFVIIE